MRKQKPSTQTPALTVVEDMPLHLDDVYTALTLTVTGEDGKPRTTPEAYCEDEAFARELAAAYNEKARKANAKRAE